MKRIIGPEGEFVTLTIQDVVDLHSILTNSYNLLPEMEPISPPGVKDYGLLESAVSRQFTGSGDYYKYSNMYLSCSTLVFGIVKNHCFFNGNKRLGFLCMLRHLSANGYILKSGISYDEIFELLRMLADNALKEHAKIYFSDFYKRNKKVEWSDELRVEYISKWIRKNCISKKANKKGNIKLSDLRRIIESKGLLFDQSGTRIKITQVGNKKFLWQKRPDVSITYNAHSLKAVSIDICEKIRKDFGLTAIEGMDTQEFYDDNATFNEHLVAYKRIIYRLAKV